MKTTFLLLRVTTGMMATAAFLILLGIVLLRSGLAFAKESVGVLGYIAKLFTSGFTQGTPPKDPAGWVVSMPQAGLAALCVAMLVSVFLPGTKNLLHILAATAGVAVIWYARMLLTEVKLEIFCLPLIAVWFLYYAMCLFWSGSQSLPKITGPEQGPRGEAPRHPSLQVAARWPDHEQEASALKKMRPECAPFGSFDPKTILGFQLCQPH